MRYAINNPAADSQAELEESDTDYPAAYGSGIRFQSQRRTLLLSRDKSQHYKLTFYIGFIV